MLELMRMQNATYEQLKSLTVSVFLSVGIIYLAFFVIKAVAVCLMAKKRSISYWWMGMIPFANFVVIGKLAGPIRIFRMNVKNMGLVVAICFGVTYIGSAVYSVITFGDYFVKLWAGSLKWDEMYEFSSVIGETLYVALGYLFSRFSAYSFLLFATTKLTLRLKSITKKDTPNNSGRLTTRFPTRIALKKILTKTKIQATRSRTTIIRIRAAIIQARSTSFN